MKKLHIFLISLFITIPCIAEDCLKETAPEYPTWDNWGKPDCWCYCRQCHGDIDCLNFLGKSVTLADLNLLKAAFNRTNAELALIPNGICADLDHDGFLGKRVTLADLNIFKTYFNLPGEDVPCCDNDQDCELEPDDKYNFWTCCNYLSLNEK
jgi:hypothetical protein